MHLAVPWHWHNQFKHWALSAFEVFWKCTVPRLSINRTIDAQEDPEEEWAADSCYQYILRKSEPDPGRYFSRRCWSNGGNHEARTFRNVSNSSLRITTTLVSLTEKLNIKRWLTICARTLLNHPGDFKISPPVERCYQLRVRSKRHRSQGFFISFCEVQCKSPTLVLCANATLLEE